MIEANAWAPQASSTMLDTPVSGLTTDQQIILTHCDLIRQNILVQEQTDNDGNGQRRFQFTGIVDWELSGWFPKYWEYAAYFVDGLWEDDWEDRFESIINPYPLEAAMLSPRLITIPPTTILKCGSSISRGVRDLLCAKCRAVHLRQELSNPFYAFVAMTTPA